MHNSQIHHSLVGTMTQCYVVFLLATWFYLACIKVLKYNTFFIPSTSVFMFRTEVSIVYFHLLTYTHTYFVYSHTFMCFRLAPQYQSLCLGLSHAFICFRFQQQYVESTQNSDLLLLFWQSIEESSMLLKVLHNGDTHHPNVFDIPYVTNKPYHIDICSHTCHTQCHIFIDKGWPCHDSNSERMSVSLGG